MAAATGGISVEVVGGEIVVTELGTTFLLAYRKSAEEPRLVLRPSRIPPTTASLRSAFRAQAWQAANDKARELGWIVRGVIAEKNCSELKRQLQAWS